MNRIYPLMLLFFLSACAITSGSKEVKGRSSVESFLSKKPSEKEVLEKYKNGFLGSFVKDGNKVYEFDYVKVSFNWPATVPIVGLFTKANHNFKGKYLYVYFNENNLATDYKIIETKGKFDGWKVM